MRKNMVSERGGGADKKKKKKYEGSRTRYETSRSGIKRFWHDD